VQATTSPVAAAPRGLSERILRSRLVEALAYPHGVDRYVELVRPLLVKREIRAVVGDVRHQTPRSVTLALHPNDNWRGLQAGQFVGLTVEIDGVRETRPYSPAGSQYSAEHALEVTVSTHPEGKVSRHLRERAHPGMIVGLTQAQGEFVLPDPRPACVLLISGGSAITPAMAMLRTLCEEGFPGEIGFLNYARSPELALYGDELGELARRHDGLRVARGFTRARGPALSGRFRREHVCAALWAGEGLAEPTVETFTPPALSFDLEGAEGLVSFAASGRHAANSGLPLLEQAEDAGLTPEHGCRMGICNTCSCRKTAGRVQNILTGETSAAGEEQIRICVSVPIGDVVLDI